MNINRRRKCELVLEGIEYDISNLLYNNNNTQEQQRSNDNNNISSINNNCPYKFDEKDKEILGRGSKEQARKEQQQKPQQQQQQQQKQGKENNNDTAAVALSISNNSCSNNNSNGAGGRMTEYWYYDLFCKRSSRSSISDLATTEFSPCPLESNQKQQQEQQEQQEQQQLNIGEVAIGVVREKLVDISEREEDEEEEEDADSNNDGEKGGREGTRKANGEIKNSQLFRYYDLVCKRSNRSNISELGNSGHCPISTADIAVENTTTPKKDKKKEEDDNNCVEPAEEKEEEEKEQELEQPKQGSSSSTQSKRRRPLPYFDLFLKRSSRSTISDLGTDSSPYDSNSYQKLQQDNGEAAMGIKISGDLVDILESNEDISEGEEVPPGRTETPISEKGKEKGQELTEREEENIVEVNRTVEIYKSSTSENAEETVDSNEERYQRQFENIKSEIEETAARLNTTEKGAQIPLNQESKKKDGNCIKTRMDPYYDVSSTERSISISISIRDSSKIDFDSPSDKNCNQFQQHLEAGEIGMGVKLELEHIKEEEEEDSVPEHEENVSEKLPEIEKKVLEKANICTVDTEENENILESQAENISGREPESERILLETFIQEQRNHHGSNYHCNGNDDDSKSRMLRYYDLLCKHSSRSNVSDLGTDCSLFGSSREIGINDVSIVELVDITEQGEEDDYSDSDSDNINNINNCRDNLLIDGDRDVFNESKDLNEGSGNNKSNTDEEKRSPVLICKHDSFNNLSKISDFSEISPIDKLRWQNEQKLQEGKIAVGITPEKLRTAKIGGRGRGGEEVKVDLSSESEHQENMEEHNINMNNYDKKRQKFQYYDLFCKRSSRSNISDLGSDLSLYNNSGHYSIQQQQIDTEEMATGVVTSELVDITERDEEEDNIYSEREEEERKQEQENGVVDDKSRMQFRYYDLFCKRSSRSNMSDLATDYSPYGTNSHHRRRSIGEVSIDVTLELVDITEREEDDTAIEEGEEKSDAVDSDRRVGRSSSGSEQENRLFVCRHITHSNTSGISDLSSSEFSPYYAIKNQQHQQLSRGEIAMGITSGLVDISERTEEHLTEREDNYIPESKDEKHQEDYNADHQIKSKENMGSNYDLISKHSQSSIFGNMSGISDLASTEFSPYYGIINAQQQLRQDEIAMGVLDLKNKTEQDEKGITPLKTQIESECIIATIETYKAEEEEEITAVLTKPKEDVAEEITLGKAEVCNSNIKYKEQENEEDCNEISANIMGKRWSETKMAKSTMTNNDFDCDFADDNNESLDVGASSSPVDHSCKKHKMLTESMRLIDRTETTWTQYDDDEEDDDIFFSQDNWQKDNTKTNAISMNEKISSNKSPNDAAIMTQHHEVEKEGNKIPCQDESILPQEDNQMRFCDSTNAIETDVDATSQCSSSIVILSNHEDTVEPKVNQIVTAKNQRTLLVVEEETAILKDKKSKLEAEIGIVENMVRHRFNLGQDVAIGYVVEDDDQVFWAIKNHNRNIHDIIVEENESETGPDFPHICKKAVNINEDAVSCNTNNSRKKNGSDDNDETTSIAQEEEEIEIEPGVFVLYKPPSQTTMAINNNKSRSISCLDCNKEFECMSNVDYVICPFCSEITPTFFMQTHASNIRQQSNNKKRRSSACLGLIKEWL